MNNFTYMKRQGYRYYVYVRPGVIEYYHIFQNAYEYARIMGAKVKELEQ